MTITELAKAHNWNLPTKCPRCRTEFIVNDSGFPECPNESCIAKVEHRFARFFSVLGIKAAGPAFIKEAAHTCQNKFDDLFLLVKNASENNVDSFNIWAGGINGEKILKQLQEYTSKKKSITVAQLCAMFDWPHLSVKQFEKIPELNLDDVININKLSYDELRSVDGIGDELALEIRKFIEAKYEDIEKLSHYFNITNSVKEEIASDKPTICFTGACPGYSRNELTEMCKSKYNVVNSVTKDLDILACADPNSGSSKLQKATKNGTKIISYDDLLKYF